MIRKAIIQGTITAFIFLGFWFGLGQVNWMKILKVDQTKKNLEQKLGDIFIDVFRKEEAETDNEFIIDTIDSLLTQICTKNRIRKGEIKLHILQTDEVNAFALPDGHLILYTGLIRASENPEALCGVICHELAHIEAGHVMKKLLKEAGLQMLLSMTSAGGSPETIGNTAGLLSSTAYDRNLEEEADEIATMYLTAAGIDAEPFASFLYSVSESKNAVQGLSWVSTHPDAEERAIKILGYYKGESPDCEKIISGITWIRLIDEIGKLNSYLYHPVQ